MRHESLRDQKVELKLANFLPEPANALTMLAGLHLRFYGGLIVVAAGHHPLLTLVARHGRTKEMLHHSARLRIMFHKLIIPTCAIAVDRRHVSIISINYYAIDAAHPKRLLLAD
jgi:hypothetical protein